MKPLLTIIRGLPGAGKSTLAETLFQQHLKNNVDVVALATDDYMTDDKGNYFFDKDKLDDCHQQCFEDACYFLLRNYVVIVHNTFTQNWEVEKYTAFAALHNIPISIIHIQGPWKSVHGVPEHTVTKMRNRWEQIWI